MTKIFDDFILFKFKKKRVLKIYIKQEIPFQNFIKTLLYLSNELIHIIT